MIKANPWLVCFKPVIEPKLRLFCFPHAGAGAGIFRTWHEQLPSDIEVCAIQLPGRERRIRETLIDDLFKLIPSLVEAILPYVDQPFAFFGHSLGALICFELSRRLITINAPTPFHLFVSACHAPQIPNPNPLTHQLPEPEFLEEIKRYNGTSPAVLQNRELMSIYSAILRADMTMNETYTYEPLAYPKSFDFPISAFGGEQDHLVDKQSLESWCWQTSGSFSLQMYPGGHFFLKDQQQKLLDFLESCCQDWLESDFSLRLKLDQAITRFA